MSTSAGLSDNITSKRIQSCTDVKADALVSLDSSDVTGLPNVEETMPVAPDPPVPASSTPLDPTVNVGWESSTVTSETEPLDTELIRAISDLPFFSVPE